MCRVWCTRSLDFVMSQTITRTHTGVRRFRRGCTSGRGGVVGQDSSRHQACEGLHRRHCGVAPPGCEGVCAVLPGQQVSVPVGGVVVHYMHIHQVPIVIYVVRSSRTTSPFDSTARMKLSASPPRLRLRLQWLVLLCFQHHAGDPDNGMVCRQQRGLCRRVCVGGR